ncbi:MAG TPA: carbamate kinase [Acidimicrobiales bacterium]|nr:carbamate kinase [Acidimicrobiales bacterium]
MRIVVALGGNALLQRGEPPDAEVQEHHVVAAVRALAPLARQHELVVTHGNGPQVGLLAIESADDPALSRPYPLDVLGAQTQGMIGYWLVQHLGNALPGREVAALVSRTLVDPDDPSFDHPTKFVGPVYGADEARDLGRRRGWTMGRDGAAWRRVVPSPTPSGMVELGVVSRLVESGVLVVCGGGGGVPVVREPHGALRGVEAVVDKDATAAALATGLSAGVLLLLTDVGAVEEGFGTPQAVAIRHTTPAALRRLVLPAGSMGPKVAAACAFVEAGGAMAAIGALEDAPRLLRGETGTVVSASGASSPDLQVA